jgi:hypothetical protein
MACERRKRCWIFSLFQRKWIVALLPLMQFPFSFSSSCAIGLAIHIMLILCLYADPASSRADWPSSRLFSAHDANPNPVWAQVAPLENPASKLY